MRADTWEFKATNFVIALLITSILWFLFKSYVDLPTFLIPFFWIMHTRAVKNRLVELNDRTRLNTDTTLLVAEVDEDVQEDFEELADTHGFSDEYDDVVRDGAKPWV